MKKNHARITGGLAAAFACLLSVSQLHAQISAFTYQGTLSNGGQTADRAFEMRFLLFDSESAGNQIGSTATVAPVDVANGLFNVSLDFGGGSSHLIDQYATHATIAGGQSHQVGQMASWASIGGGKDATVANSVVYATIAGGQGNTVNANHGAIGGGASNTAGGTHSVVPGGQSNSAGGNHSFAAGRQAKANHTGSFVWSDSGATDFASAANNEFAVNASGGVRLVTGGAGLTVDGNAVPAGNGSVTSSHLANDSVTSSHLAADSVNATHIAASSVTSSEIANDTIAAADIDQTSLGVWLKSGSDTYYGSGKVGIGTAAPAVQLHVTGSTALGSIAVTPGSTTGNNDSELIFSENRYATHGCKFFYDGGDNYLKFIGLDNGTETTPWMYFSRVNGRLGISRKPTTESLEVAGDIMATGQIYETSDRRLKKNIQPLENTLEKVREIRPVTFHMKDQPDSSKRKIGVIAQEALEIFPELVNEDGDHLSVSYNQFGVIALKAIQEMDVTINEQKQEIDSLRSRLDKLERLLAAQPATTQKQATQETEAKAQR